MELAGGSVTVRKRDNSNGYGIPRVNGVLAVSRAWGDIFLKEPKPIVSTLPHIRIEFLTPAGISSKMFISRLFFLRGQTHCMILTDSFLILGSDGVWDVVSDEEAVEIVKKAADPEEASKALVKKALKKGSSDNCTAVVVFFHWNVEPTS